MTTLAAPHTAAVPRPSRIGARPTWPAARWTAAVVVGAGLSLAVALAAAAPGAPADPDLAHLMRGMALVKGLLVALGGAAVGWRRLRRPTPALFALAYVGLVGVAPAAAGATWQLADLGRAAMALHAAGALLVVLAWCDREFVPRPVR